MLTCAEALSRYTMTICRNEKVMPKSQRWLLTQRIVGAALGAVECITKANSAPLNEPVGVAMRYIWQLQARANLRTLLTLLDLAHAAFGLELHRVEHWTELTVETDKCLSAWIKSDRQRAKLPGIHDVISALQPAILAVLGLAEK